MFSTLQKNYHKQRDLGGKSNEIGVACATESVSSRVDALDGAPVLAWEDSRRRFTGRTSTAPSPVEVARERFESGSKAVASALTDARKLFEKGSTTLSSHVVDAKKRFESGTGQSCNSSEPASKSSGFQKKWSQRQHANSNSSWSTTPTVSIGSSDHPRLAINERSRSEKIASGTSRNNPETYNVSDDRTESNSGNTNSARTMFRVKIRAKVPGDTSKIVDLKKNNGNYDRTEINSGKTNNAGTIFGPRIRAKVPVDPSKIVNLETNNDSDDKTENSSGQANNAKTIFGAKIRAKVPGDPSKMSYRQRIEQIRKIKESIKRAKEGKGATTPKTIDDKNEDMDEDEDAAALFFNARKLPTVEESITASFSERFGGTNLAHKTISQENEKRNDSISFDYSANTLSSPNNQNSSDDLSPNQSSDVCTRDAKSTSNPVLGTATVENPIDKNVETTFSAGLGKARTSDVSGSEFEQTKIKQAVVTMKITSASTEKKVELFGSPDSFNGSFSSHSDTDSHSNGSSIVPLRNNARYPENNKTVTQESAKLATDGAFFADLAKTTNSVNDDFADSDLNSGSGSGSLNSSSDLPDNIRKDYKKGKNETIDVITEFFVDQGNEKDYESSDSDLSYSYDSTYYSAATKNEENASIDKGFDSDSDDNSLSSKAKGKRKQKSSTYRKPGSDSDSDDSSNQSEFLTSMRKKSLDSDDGSKPFRAITNFESNSVCSSNLSKAITTKEIKTEKNNMPSVYSESGLGADDTSNSSEHIIWKGQATKHDVSKDLDSETDDTTKSSGEIEGQNTKTKNIGTAVLYSDSGLDSNDCPKNPEALLRKDREADDDGSYGLDSKCNDNSKQPGGVKAKTRKTENGGMFDVHSYSDCESSSDDSAKSLESMVSKAQEAKKDSSYCADSDSLDSSKQSAVVKVEVARAANSWMLGEFSDSDLDSDASSKSSKSKMQKGQKAQQAHGLYSDSPVNDFKIDKNDSSESDSNSNVETKSSGHQTRKDGLNTLEEGVTSSFLQVEDKKNGDDFNSNSTSGSVKMFLKEFNMDELPSNYEQDDAEFLADLTTARNDVTNEQSIAGLELERSSNPSNKWWEEGTSKHSKYSSTNVLEGVVAVGNHNPIKDDSKHESNLYDEVEATTFSNKTKSVEERFKGKMKDSNISKTKGDAGRDNSESVLNNICTSESPKNSTKEIEAKSEKDFSISCDAFLSDVSTDVENVNPTIKVDGNSEVLNSLGRKKVWKQSADQLPDNPSTKCKTTEFERQPSLNKKGFVDQNLQVVEITGNDEESNFYNNEEARILLLHEEMKKIGLSPTIRVNTDDMTCRSMNTAFSKDSYLEDLLTQREDRQNERREEAREEALEVYHSFGEPKSESLFLAILEKISQQKEEASAQRDLIQKTLIEKELAVRGYHINRNQNSVNEPKTQEPNKTKKPSEASQSTSDEGQTQAEKPRSLRKKKKNLKGQCTQLVEEGVPSTDRSGLKSKCEENAGVHNLKRSNVGIECGRKNEAAILTTESDTIHEKLSSHFSPEPISCDEDQTSVNRFESEYYYDEERAMIDRQAIRLLEKEAQLSRQEFTLTRKMMLASTAICCLAFVLALIFVLDPLDRRAQTKMP